MYIPYTNDHIYIGNFDKNRRIYFLIKEEKVFIKYMEILEIAISSKTQTQNEAFNVYMHQ